MCPDNVQTEVPAEGDLGRRFGAAGIAETVDARNRKSEIVAFKFGGTSLLGAKRMLHAASLVHSLASETQVVVIVSAMKGVTDRLLAIGRLLAGRNNSRA